jgi:small subunit ribosomal protein S4
MKLFLKGTRCDTPKCAIERRDAPPGAQQARRGKLTDYGQHLREKQKVKHYYGILERQFKAYFARASRSKGNTGATLLSLLERRLDNVVHRLGFGQSRAQARQLVRHGHITVNGRRVDIPSYLLQPGDVIRVKNRVKSLEAVQVNMSVSTGRQLPDFLQLVEGPIPEGVMSRLPEPEDVSIPVQPQLIVELCSR